MSLLKTLGAANQLQYKTFDYRFVVITIFLTSN